MDLTPIHIPGKRKRDMTKKAAIAVRKSLLLPNDVESDASSRATKPKKRKTMKNLKSRRKMSNLEKLPTELLEKVFLYCMNIDLPMSSPIIAAKLSSQPIYGKALIAAFGPTWEKWYGKGGQLRQLQEVEANSENSGQDPHLQSTILRSRWASLPTILKAKQTWIQKFAKGGPFKPHYFLKIENPHEDNPEDVQEEHHDHLTRTRLTATEYFEADYKGFCDFTSQYDEERICSGYSWKLNMDVAVGVRIPQSLLSGPWTEEMVRHLFWLTKSGAGIDWLHSTDGEVAMDGLKNAISSGDTRVIHLLQWSGLLGRLSADTLIWAFRNASGDKLAVVNQLLRWGLSILDYKDNRRVVSELEELEDEAIQNNDQDTFNFVKGVYASLAYTPKK